MTQRNLRGGIDLFRRLGYSSRLREVGSESQAGDGRACSESARVPGRVQEMEEMTDEGN